MPPTSLDSCAQDWHRPSIMLFQTATRQVSLGHLVQSKSISALIEVVDSRSDEGPSPYLRQLQAEVGICVAKGKLLVIWLLGG